MSELGFDCEQVLEAIPHAVFVVNDEVAIQYANAAGLRLLGSERQHVLKRRGGDALHCIHSYETPDGCGHSASCRSCVIRNAVAACLSGRELKRSRMKLQLVAGGNTTDLELLITATVLSKEKRLAVLIFEDISEVTSLRQIVAMCAHCRRLRNAQQEWLRVEAFFKHEVGLDFSHGICPECVTTHYSELLKDEAKDAQPA